MVTRVSVYSEAGWQRDLANMNRGRRLHACTSYVKGGQMVCFHTSDIGKEDRNLVLSFLDNGAIL